MLKGYMVRVRLGTLVTEQSDPAFENSATNFPESSMQLRLFDSFHSSCGQTSNTQPTIDANLLQKSIANNLCRMEQFHS